MDELISEGLCVFTDLDDDHGTLDLDKCGEEARLYRAKRAVADRRLAAARKKEEARAEAEAARLAKAEAAAAARRQEEERLARLRAQAQQTDARSKRRTANGKATRGGPSKSNVSKSNVSNVSKSKAKRAAERSEPNDSGAEMLMAAAALMASGEENGEVTGAVTMTDRNAGNAERSAKRHRGNAMPPPPSLPLARRGEPSAKSARARGETAVDTIAAPKTTKTIEDLRSKEERLAEEHREKFLEATAAAEMAKRDAAAAKARADAAFEAAKRLGDSPLARIPPSPRDASLAAASPARRAATKTSLTQRLAESTAADANANFQNSPSSSAEKSSSEDDGVSHEATDDDARDALGDVVAKPGAKPAAPAKSPARAAPASRKQVLSEDDTRVETTVETADAPNPRHQSAARADPSASLTFAGATPTSWIARLLTSRMSGDPTIRAALLCALCAVEEKRLDFAERLLTEHDFECGWRFRLLEYLDRARGRDGSAADNARLARRCEAREAAAREARREREARETDALRAEEDEWRSARGPPPDGALANARDKADGDARPGAPVPARVFADESDPFFDERPGAGLKILDASKRPEATKRSDGDEALGDVGKETRAVPATSSGDRHAARRDTNAFVKRSPADSAAAPGVAPSGPLPVRGASGAGVGALGAAFALFAENAGAADLEDWKRMRRVAKRDAAARPAEALTLTLAGLLAWRVGDLEGAKAPLRAAMHHDGVAARAAPLLFEVLLLLDETDEAEVVWDTALHRGESGPTYERLIAVALRCGEGGEGGAGEPLGESDKRTEGDSERR